MAKHNEVGRPYFPRASGEVEVNIADHDGIIRFGSGPYDFETYWEPLGNRARVYNDGTNIRGVAVMRDSQAWMTLDLDTLQTLNFTSRRREASPGQVVVFENTGGYFLVAMILRIDQLSEDEQILALSYYMVDLLGLQIREQAMQSPPDGDSRHTFLTTDSGEFLTDDEGNFLVVSEGPSPADAAVTGSPVDENNAGGESFIVTLNQDGIAAQPSVGRPELSVSDSTLAAGYGVGDFGAGGYGGSAPEAFDLYQIAERALPGAVAEAIEALEQAAAQVGDAPAHGAPGSNNPPPDMLLDDNARLEVIEALRSLSLGSAAEPGKFAAAISKVRQAADRLYAWVSPHIAEGAAKGVTEGVKWAVVAAITTTVLKLVGVLDFASQIVGMMVLGG